MGSLARRRTVKRAAHHSIPPTAYKKIVQSAIENSASLLGSDAFKLAQGRLTEPVKNKSLLRVLYHNQLVNFSTKNQYIAGPEQLWQVESLIGTQALTKALSSGQTIDDQFIEKLFRKAPFTFYLDSDEAYLLSSDDELTRLDFGPLTIISALDALQRFGLTVMERAREKTAVRL